MNDFLFDRRKLMEMLVSVSIVSLNPHCSIGIVVPSFGEAKRFSKDLISVLEEVPGWLRPKLLTNTIRRVEFETGVKICILYSDICSKGMMFRILYASSRVTDKQMAIHCYGVFPHGEFTRFEDT